MSVEDVVSRLSAILRTVPARQVEQYGNKAGGRPAVASLYASESRDPSVSAEILDHASALARRWTLDAAPQLMDALESVLSTPSARQYGPHPLVRSILEYAARASWLMECDIGPRARGARAWLVEAVSADSMLQAMKGSGAQAWKDAEGRRDRTYRRIARLFGDDGLSTTGNWSCWTLAGEPYGSPSAVVEGFAQRYFPASDGRGAYMRWSTLVHPSAASATAFGTPRDDDEVVSPDLDIRFLSGAVRTATTTWYVAVHAFVVYNGWSASELDAWWSSTMEALAATDKANAECCSGPSLALSCRHSSRNWRRPP
jgi:hypothetical protein